MPETKVLVGALVAITVNILLAVTSDPQFLEPLPDHWEGPAATILGFAAAWFVRNRHLSPSSLATAANHQQ
jgi:hypothetical protein